MTKRMRGFLDSLERIDPDKLDRTASDNAPDPVGERMKRMELSERNTGKLIIRLAPEDCVVWAGNARSGAALTPEACSELIESIRSEGGNRIPVIVRYRKNAPAHEPRFELLVGTRRHFAVRHLRAHDLPQLQLLAQVEEVDDEAAFRLQDIENRARADISDIERARSYQGAIDLYYGGVALRMAERLGLSSGHLTKLLAIARLPQEIVDAFGGDAQVTVASGYAVQSVLDRPHNREVLLERAAALAAEQHRRRLAGLPLMSAAAVAADLLGAAAGRTARAAPAKPSVHAGSGAPLFKVLADRKDGLTIQIVADRSEEDEELAARVLEAVRASRLRARKSQK